MKTFHFNPLDPLRLFESIGESRETPAVPAQASQAEISRFLADVRKNIPDEQRAKAEYTRMSREAERIGFPAVAKTLLGMAQDEGRHEISLRDMTITIW